MPFVRTTLAFSLCSFSLALLLLILSHVRFRFCLSSCLHTSISASSSSSVHFSISGRCCFGGFSVSLTIFSAVRPSLQTLAPSSLPHPSPKICIVFPCFFGLRLFLLVLISLAFGVFFCVRNNLFFTFSKFQYVIPSSLAIGSYREYAIAIEGGAGDSLT